ncbi:MAG: hypothetical protein JXR20_03010 [Balneola sp.]
MNHTLRTDLQEWKSRLYKARHQQFGSQLKYFLTRIDETPILNGLINEACSKYSFTNEELEIATQYSKRVHNERVFIDQVEESSFYFQLIKFMIKKADSYDLHNDYHFSGRTINEMIENLIEELITPIIYFFHDELDKSNSITYLLEKYKKRTEWFKKESLFDSYKKTTGTSEDIFEDDLREFLFDQGIDYPFSTPKSSSGRSDIVGNIDTSDPLICEIKIYDSEKGYRKNRIIDGFTQIVQYTNDYNKNEGYLVIYNLDEVEINFEIESDNQFFPTSFIFNNKRYYFIVINLRYDTTASQRGKMKVVEIQKSELTKAIN